MISGANSTVTLTVSDVDATDTLTLQVAGVTVGSLNNGSESTVTLMAQSTVLEGYLTVVDGNGGSVVTDTYVVLGTNGNDTMLLPASAIKAAVFGFQDTDTLVVSNGDSTTIELANANDQTTGDGSIVTGFENVDASAVTTAMTISGDATDNVLIGGAGPDSISGGDGNDTIDADDQDSISGGGGSDTVRFAAAVSASNLLDADLDSVESVLINNTGNAAYDFSAQSEALNISGGNGDDTITGSSASDTLFGGAGTDVLIATDTDVLIDGGAGSADTVQFSAAVSAANLANGDLVNTEAILITNASSAAYDFSAQTENLSITGGDAVDSITGGSGNDTITGNGGADSLLGGGGDDLFRYTTPSEVAEDATIIGGLGTDTLRMATGESQIAISDVTFQKGSQLEVLDLAGSGDIVLALDNFAGLAFANGIEVKVNEAASSLTIGAGFLNVALNLSNGTVNGDVVTGGSQNDTLRAGGGDDSLLGGLGADVLYGEDGLDSLFGGAGIDQLFGGADDDALNGDAGNDTINGGEGDDILTGGSGIDSLTGDTGLDTFYFATGDIDTTAGAVTDIITDFSGDFIRGSFGAGSVNNFVSAGSISSTLGELLTAADGALNGTVDYYVGQVGSDSYLISDSDGSGYTDVVKFNNIAFSDITRNSLI